MIGRDVYKTTRFGEVVDTLVRETNLYWVSKSGRKFLKSSGFPQFLYDVRWELKSYLFDENFVQRSSS